MSDTSNPITHVFDQTNGVIEGESDGTAAGERSSAAERDDATPAAEGRAQDVGGPGGAGAAPLVDTAPLTEADVDTTSSTATATSGAQAPADQEESGVEHTFAVDPAGSATDEGPTAGAAAGSGGDAGSVTSRDTAASHDEGLADAARVSSPVTAVAVDRDDEGVTTTDAYDRGPANEVGSTDRDGDAVPDTAETSAAVPDAPRDDATTSSDAAGADRDGRTAPDSLAALVGDDDSIGHVFDQTNGVVEGLDGDSDGLAADDDESAADREGLNEPNPVGQQDAWHDDHYGAADGRDPNP